MADAPLGTPYKAAFLVLDAAGSPILTGVAGSGMSLYGPDSATALSTGTALTHFGNGYWGVAYAASVLTATGVYRYTVPSLTGPSGLAFSNVSDEFSVGPADPRYRTLRDNYTRLRVVRLQDGETSTSTGGSTTTLVDSAYAGYSQDGDYKGSELVILEPGAVTDANPVRVTNYTTAAGTFTFTPAVTAVVAGIDYLIGNINGGGWTHQQVIGALRAAFDEAAARQPVSDEVTLAATMSAYEYPLPATWRAVTGVWWRPWPGTTITGDWRRLWPGPDYEIVPDRRRLRLANLRQANTPLRIEGLVAPEWPAGMAGLVQVDPEWLTAKAAFELLVPSARPDRQRQAASLYAWLERHPLRHLPDVDEVALA